MTDLIKLPFDVLLQFAPLIEYTMIPIFCFGLFLGGICLVKELFR